MQRKYNVLQYLVILYFLSFGALMLLDGEQEGHVHAACKKYYHNNSQKFTCGYHPHLSKLFCEIWTV